MLDKGEWLYLLNNLKLAAAGTANAAATATATVKNSNSGSSKAVSIDESDPLALLAASVSAHRSQRTQEVDVE
jgi:hypothetical protein